MPRLSILILTILLLMGLAVAFVLFIKRNQGVSRMGKPSIDSFYFYSGKLSLFSSILLFIPKAILPSLGYIQVPKPLAWIAVALLFTGSVTLVLAVAQLGDSLLMGLPSGKTTLRQNGLYAVSRNPIYVSLYMIVIASCLFFPDLLNLAFAVYGIVIHHRIIKSEETFLARRFGDEWISYTRKTRRYL